MFLFRGWHSSMLWIFQKWQFDKGFEFLIYMYIYIWYQNSERERERSDIWYVHIYISQEWDIATKLPSVEPFCTHILKPVRKFTRELRVFLGVYMLKGCMDKSVRPKMVLVYPNLKTIEMFILKWFGNLRWNKKVHHPKSHAANKKNVKSESQELDTRPITRSGGALTILQT